MNQKLPVSVANTNLKQRLKTAAAVSCATRGIMTTKNLTSTISILTSQVVIISSLSMASSFSHLSPPSSCWHGFLSRTGTNTRLHMSLERENEIHKLRNTLKKTNLLFSVLALVLMEALPQAHPPLSGRPIPANSK